MRLEQLEYIVTVHKTHSILKAAELLYISQPSISSAISALEKELGVKLFTRTKTGTFATTEGLRIIALAENILKNVKEIYGIEGEKNILNLFTIGAIGSGILPEILSKWHKTYPDDTVAVTEHAVNDIFEQFSSYIQKTQTRCFCICSIHPGRMKYIAARLREENIHIHFLGNDELMCLIHKDNSAAKQSSISISQCNTLPIIKYKLMTNENAWENDHFSSQKDTNLFDDTNAHFIVNTLENLRRFVALDLGIAIMPSIMFYNDHYIQEQVIKLLPFSDDVIPIDYYLLYNGDEKLSTKEENFVRYVNEVFSQWNKFYAYLKAIRENN